MIDEYKAAERADYVSWGSGGAQAQAPGAGGGGGFGDDI